jgi:hypothetical protein
VDKIDPFEGMLAEDHLPGADVGPTLKAMLVDQFTRLRDGDRFFYLNEALTSNELSILQGGNTLTRVIEANTGLTNLQNNLFFFKASIGGTVFLDPANGGTPTPGGVEMAGLTVNLNDDSGKVIATTTTDSFGRFRFTDQTGLPGTGQFTVSLVLPPGLRLATPDPGQVLINRGDIDMTVNFGIASETIVPPAPTPAARGVVASLVAMGRKKRLRIVERFADTGTVKAVFLSPFQPPRFKHIAVTTVDTNGDGVADCLVVTAFRHGKKHRAVLPA